MNVHLVSATKATFSTLSDASALSAQMSFKSKTALKESSGIRLAASASACLKTAQVNNSGQAITASVFVMPFPDTRVDKNTRELTRTASAMLMLSLTSS